VNEFFQTDVPHIYAAGDVIGFPALASTSMEQGAWPRVIMFGVPFEHMPELFPYGIYTIPEVSMVGQTEETQLYSDKIPYEWELQSTPTCKEHDARRRGRNAKLLFDPKLTNPWRACPRAARDRIIHIGQAVRSMAGRGIFPGYGLQLSNARRSL